MTRYRDEPNIWRTLVSIALLITISISILYIYNTYMLEEEDNQIDEDTLYIDFLFRDKDTYITPDEVSNFTKEVLNNTKDLNISDHITIYRYIRENFGLIDSNNKPRPPVETISRGHGSRLDLSLLYTSILIHLEKDAYLFLTNEGTQTILFQNETIYIFELSYYSPLEIKNPVNIIKYNTYTNITIISDSLTRQFDEDFYMWSRRKLDEHK